MALAIRGIATTRQQGNEAIRQQGNRARGKKRKRVGGKEKATPCEQESFEDIYEHVFRI
jgi:hypothetical protein